MNMELQERIKRPSKKEQIIAKSSYEKLEQILDEIKEDSPVVEIEETQEKITIPLSALKLLSKILKETSNGKPVSIVSIAAEMTTQAAAELLGCSRPHLVKLLESGKIQFTKIGRHRRIKYDDIINYRSFQKKKQEDTIAKMMSNDEELGLYDS